MLIFGDGAYPRMQLATAEQTSMECALYRPPYGLHCLIDADADATTREWLLSKFPEI